MKGRVPAIDIQPLPNLWSRYGTPYQTLRQWLFRHVVALAVGDIDDRSPSITESGVEESSLVAAMGRRDGGATKELYGRYADRVFRFIYRRIGESVEDVEDLTLETFTSAVDLARTFDGRSSVFVWLCGIARIRIIDFHRRHTRAKRSSPGGVVSWSDLGYVAEAGINPKSSSGDVVDRIAASTIVDELLARLTPDEREALVLHYVEELTIDEVASHLRRTPKAVKSLLTRAKEKARQSIKDRPNLEEALYE